MCILVNSLTNDKNCKIVVAVSNEIMFSGPKGFS